MSPVYGSGVGSTPLTWADTKAEHYRDYNRCMHVCLCIPTLSPVSMGHHRKSAIRGWKDVHLNGYNLSGKPVGINY